MAKIQTRGGTAAAWSSANTVLADRELGVETDTQRIKFGDGSTAWNSLPYALTNVPPIISNPVSWEIQRVTAGAGPSQPTTPNVLKAFTGTAFDTIVRHDGIQTSDITTSTAAVIVPYTGDYDLGFTQGWGANVTSILCFIRTPAGGGTPVVAGGISATYATQSVATHSKSVRLSAGDTIQPGYFYLNNAATIYGPYPVFTGVLQQRTA